MIQWIMTGVNRVCCPWIIVANCSLRSQSWTKQTACNGRQATMDRERGKYWPQQIYRPTIKTSAPGLIYRARPRFFPNPRRSRCCRSYLLKAQGFRHCHVSKRRLTTDIVYIYIYYNVTTLWITTGGRGIEWTHERRLQEKPTRNFHSMPPRASI